MSVFLNLPTELCHEILDEWLVIQHWGILDVALSNKILNICLLEQFKLLSNSAFPISCKSSVFEWINARNIKLKYLNVDESMIDSEGVLKMSLRLESVFDLNIAGFTTGCVATINQCPSLKQLHVCNAYALVDVNPQVCSELTSIIFTSAQTLPLMQIRDNCLKLRTFQYDHGSNGIYSLLCEIIENNSMLENLMITGDASVVATIHKHCKHLKVLRLTLEDIELEHIRCLFTECPSLNNYYFSTNLERLTLDNCPVELWEYISMNCSKHLNFVDIRFHGTISLASITHLIRNCSEDCSINIHNFESITVQYENSKILSTVTINCACRIISNIGHFVAGLKGVNEINLDYIANEDIPLICSSCLCKLVLCGISMQSVVHVLDHCPNLLHLDVSVHCLPFETIAEKTYKLLSLSIDVVELFEMNLTTVQFLMKFPDLKEFQLIISVNQQDTDELLSYVKSKHMNCRIYYDDSEFEYVHSER